MAICHDVSRGFADDGVRVPCDVLPPSTVELYSYNRERKKHYFLRLLLWLYVITLVMLHHLVFAVFHRVYEQDIQR